MESVSTHRERPNLAKRKRSPDSVIDESFESGRKDQKRIRVVSPDFSHQSTRGIDPVAAAPRQRAASLDLSRTNQSVEITRSVSASDLEVPRPVEALEALAEVAALATPTPPPPTGLGFALSYRNPVMNDSDDELSDASNDRDDMEVAAYSEVSSRTEGRSSSKERERPVNPQAQELTGTLRRCDSNLDDIINSFDIINSLAISYPEEQMAETATPKEAIEADSMVDDEAPTF
tara:strand:+ start:186 stop:884 length:699 start_codon:yes stop_codon:yes gene_type:complete